jgi:hypothetical protein
MTEMQSINAIKLAIKNISNYGDTDIFPYQIENALFYDSPEKIAALVNEMRTNFKQWSAEYPVDKISVCIPLNYTGFRWATLIDPVWNCFLLSQVIEIAIELEKNRIPIEKESVFSYRINLDEESGKLFRQDVSWRQYIETSIRISESSNYSWVVRFDISDFYNRVYHHRLEQALRATNAEPQTIKVILEILQDLSINVSYGLPVGGNAARILAEMVLNPMDQLMVNKRIRFCRFVDDYILFARSKEEAFQYLNWCAAYLLRTEGLSLQKSKTQVLPVAEFITHARSQVGGDDEESNKARSEFLNLHIHYDPYSDTANEDYQSLKGKLNRFDVIGILKDEVRKSRIHQALGKNLMRAISFLDGEELGLALQVVSSNIEILYPVFPSILQMAKNKLPEADLKSRSIFINALCKLIEQDSYITLTDNNASYAVRVLSTSSEEAATQAIVNLYARDSPLVKANCIYAMANMRNRYWLSDIKASFSTMTKWERRAFIAASYILKDEGHHWREHTKNQFSKLEKLVRDWVASKEPSQNNWNLPL